ncbi:MAG: polysaccharide export protein [Deltaproteobacteria bacterium]|nr:MAG: polysaccharide export protein [Deltaproteobacteria bacterium]
MRNQGTINAIIIVSFLFLAIIGDPIPLSLAQGKGYCIGSRDVLALAIYAGGEKQQEVALTVSSEGMINVPFVGPVKAEGLTVSKLESLIEGPLAKDYFVNPDVNIRVIEYHSLHYYISGAVNSPGLYEVNTEATLMELIAKAGGVSPDRGNIAYIFRESVPQLSAGDTIENLISHRDPIKADLKNLLDKGDMSHNILLHAGDVVYIPPQKVLNLSASKVYVEGEVKSPGVYEYQEGLTALNACIMAGGFDKFAAPNRTKIVRKNGNKQIVIKVNLNDVKDGKIPDIALKPGDRIHIPETWL